MRWRERGKERKLEIERKRLMDSEIERQANAQEREERMR